MQKIEDAGSTDVNLDYYPVRIETWPTVNGTVLSGVAFVRYVRKNINTFIDPSISKFWPLNAEPDGPRYNSDSPFVAVMGITITPDNGAVVVAEVDATYWRFVTVRILFRQTGLHSVSGTREFGLRAVGDGNGGIFYIRGLDCTTEWPETWFSGTAFGEAKKLWISLQNQMADWVNRNKGKARVMEFVQKEVRWEDVKRGF